MAQQITGGSVTFGRTVQPAQYESKKSEVTLTFAVEEGAQVEEARAMLDMVSKLAREKCLELLGLKSVDTPTTEGARPNAKPENIQNTDGQPAKPARTKAKETPATPPKSDARTADDDILGAAAHAAAESANEAKEAAAHADPDGDLLGASAPQPITDKELMDAVSKKNTEIANPAAIKKLREEFVATPKGIRDIPADQRRSFLDKLALLKKA